jgi:hypothetical protein
MKTKPAASADPSTSVSGSTKPTRQPEPIDGAIRLPGWPECLADEAVAASIKSAVYEGYEQKSGRRTGIYRVR